ncbi:MULTISPECIES: phosphoglycerate mutase [Solibacillus]|uniref:Phosphoglycerate mutase n=1 Tax=Solibacillus merdavium TaxID=2762218 RepID=A0ABR8XLZ8_9BACL|nr:phosphoglycerate mutase [Solibacillus merdavium]MBD8032974.1 phosphoglycerate mutase [Solibacillus merdavium]
MDGIDTSKEAIKMDLAFIKSCLRLVNQTVILNIRRGETFTASENEEIHMLISKIEKDLNKIKKNIDYEPNHITKR